MVIGHGLIARAFEGFKNDPVRLIFASGVSNSNERNHDVFQREKELLLQQNVGKYQLIYFSTVSVYDPDLAASPYIKHKLELEKLITEIFHQFIIFRLPIVVSDSTNPHTLTNFIFNQIINKQPVPIFTKACRYLMDIADIQALVGDMILSNNYANQIVDINFNNAIWIEDLVSIYENTLNKKVIKTYFEKGGCYQTKNEIFINYLNEIKYNLDKDYLSRTIKKYYTQ